MSYFEEFFRNSGFFNYLPEQYKFLINFLETVISILEMEVQNEKCSHCIVIIWYSGLSTLLFHVVLKHNFQELSTIWRKCKELKLNGFEFDDNEKKKALMVSLNYYAVCIEYNF